MSKDLRKAVSSLKRFQRLPPHIPGKLGNGAGVVTVPGFKYKCYVRTSVKPVPITVRNTRTPHMNDLDVFVGWDPLNPGVLQVLGENIYGSYEPVNNPSVGQHGASHVWGGSDVVYVDTKQIINATVYPTSGLSVVVNPGVLRHATGFTLVKPTTIDLTSYVPGSDMRFVVIQVDDDGDVAVKQGSTFGIDEYGIEQIPAPDEGYAPLYAIRLFDGQTEISNEYSNSDLTDLRFTTRVYEYETHASRHEDGGDDEIDVTDLSGKLADPQNAGWIRGVEVDSTAPTDDQVLRYDVGSTKYKPETLATLEVKEQDGTPTVDPVTEIRVPNTTLTDEGGGAVSLDMGLPLTVKEQDGTPSVSDVTEVRVTNGKLTDEGSGAVSLELGGSGLLAFWDISGALAVQTGVGISFVAPRDMSIASVIMHVGTKGSAGATTIDVNKNGTSIFPTTPKPSVPYDDADGIDEAVPDTQSVSKDDVITVDIDAIATGAADLIVEIVESVSAGASQTWESLTDTPSPLSSYAGRLSRVNEAGNAIETVEYDEKWEPDAPPSSPGSIDDEFDDSSIDVAWTTSGTVTEPASCYGLSIKDNGYAQRALAGGDFTLWSKVSIGGKPQFADFVQAGLFVQQGSGGLWFCGLVANNTNHCVARVMNYSSKWVWVSSPVNLENRLLNVMYVSIRKNSGTLSFWFSADGLLWNRVYTTTTYPTPTIAGVCNINTGSEAIFSFFRYDSTYRAGYWQPPGRKVARYIYT